MHADKLPITGPCPIDLDAIGFDRTARVARCTHCTKDVHVLSNMSRGEALSFLRDHRGQRLCVSYARDEHGRIRFRSAPPAAPEPALVPVARLRIRPSRAAGFVAALGVSAALAACTPHGDPPPAPAAAPASVTVVEPPPPTPPPVVVEVVPRPEDIPMAGMMVVPEEVVDGEMEVPDPDAIDLDAPCDQAGSGVVPPPERVTTTTVRRGMQPL